MSSIPNEESFDTSSAQTYVLGLIRSCARIGLDSQRPETHVGRQTSEVHRISRLDVQQPVPKRRIDLGQWVCA